MDDQDDILVEKIEPDIATIPDHNNLDSYIKQLRDCAIKIKNRICCTGRYTIAGFYEEAATALETYRDTGSIPEIGNAEECAEYVSAVTVACQNGLGDNTVRTPKQWVKKIR